MKGMKCSCGKVAEYDTGLSFNGYQIDGWKCLCGEVYYNPEKAERVLLLHKLKKKKYHLRLNKVKSNLIVRIPKEVGEALHLEEGNEVELGLRSNKEIVLHSLA